MTTRTPLRLAFWSAWLAIGYTLLGYPLAVAALARLAPRPWRRQPITPPLTLIVPAYNEASWIERKLDNSLALDYPREQLHILVVADGSDDGSPGLVERYAERGVELLYEPRREGKAAALNRAAQRARGEVLVFSDANTLLARDALRQLVASFADPRVAVVTGAKMVVGDHRAFGTAEALYWRYEGWIRANESLVGQATGANGELLAVRRADWQPLPPSTVNDDFAIAFDALARGRRVVFEPRARAVETPTVAITDEVARRRRILAGRWRALSGLARLLRPPRPLALWQVASHKGARALLPFFASVAALSSIGLVTSGGRASAWPERLAVGGQLGLGTLIAARALGLPLPPPARAAASAATYLAASQYADLAGFLAWLRGHQGPTWAKAARQPAVAASP